MVLMTPLTKFKSYSAQPIDNENGLVGWWTFDDGTATDWSGNQNNGVFVNAPVSGAGIIYNSIKFNGTNQRGTTSAIDLKSNGTVCAWIFVTGNGTPDAGNTVDILANVSGNGNQGWSLGLRVNTNLVDFYVANNGSLGVELLSNTAIIRNSWVHTAVTYDGTTKKIYINGILDASIASTVNGAFSAAWGFASRPSTPLRSLQGSIDDPRLYIRALLPAEINAIYNQGIAYQQGNPIAEASII